MKDNTELNGEGILMKCAILNAADRGTVYSRVLHREVRVSYLKQ
jgi:hypothetical protein